MKPYYQDSHVTIYHGDCRDVLADQLSLRGGSSNFDLLLTDPPYGISAVARGTIGSANKGVVKDYGKSEWDNKTVPEAVAQMRSLCRWHIIFGGNYYDLPPSSCWLVWDKDNTGDFADCELAWTNLRKAVRKLTYRWNGMLQQPGVPREKREHPTQKPEAVMRWALSQAPESVVTVLDPFLGSGTTLVAAKRVGRTAVGVEREERYCEIAARRAESTYPQGSLFVADDAPPSESQGAMWE